MTIPEPTWQPDCEAQDCFLCTTEFTMFNRRHHCRACGLLVCGSCSTGRRQLKDRPGQEPSMQRGCDICANDSIKLKEFIEAGDIDKLKAVISKVREQGEVSIKFALNSKFSDQSFALLRATESKDNASTIVPLLIQNGADVNLQKLEKETPLIVACQTENLLVFEALLAAGANPDLGEKNCLQVAAVSNRPAFVTALLSHNQFKAKNEPVLGLLAAAQAGHVEATKAFLQHPYNSVDVNAEGPQGKTALAYAAEKGRAALCHVLLETGALIQDYDQMATGEAKDVLTAAKQAVESKKTKTQTVKVREMAAPVTMSPKAKAKAKASTSLSISITKEASIPAPVPMSVPTAAAVPTVVVQVPVQVPVEVDVSVDADADVEGESKSLVVPEKEEKEEKEEKATVEAVKKVEKVDEVEIAEEVHVPVAANNNNNNNNNNTAAANTAAANTAAANTAAAAAAVDKTSENVEVEVDVEKTEEPVVVVDLEGGDVDVAAFSTNTNDSEAATQKQAPNTAGKKKKNNKKKKKH